MLSGPERNVSTDAEENHGVDSECSARASNRYGNTVMSVCFVSIQCTRLYTVEYSITLAL